MAYAYNAIVPQSIICTATTLNNASGTSAVTIYTAGAQGARIENLIAVSTDTSARDAQICVGSGNVIGTISIAIGAGSASGTAAKDVLMDSNIPTIADANGNPVIYLAASQTLQITMPVAITAAKTITFTVMGSSF